MAALRSNKPRFGLYVVLAGALSLGAAVSWAEPGTTPHVWLNPDQHLQDSLERSRQQAATWPEMEVDDSEAAEEATVVEETCTDSTGATLHHIVPTAEQRWANGVTPGPCALTEADAKRGIDVLSLNPLRTELLAQAQELLGTPYRRGGLSPSGFDCSGFVYYTLQQVGITLPRRAHDQYLSAERVARTELKPGDLVFFKTSRRSKKITHVGIYLGDNRFIHAPSRHKHVTVSTLGQGYWRQHFVTGGRLLPA